MKNNELKSNAVFKMLFIIVVQELFPISWKLLKLRLTEPGGHSQVHKAFPNLSLNSMTSGHDWSWK